MRVINLRLFKISNVKYFINETTYISNTLIFFNEYVMSISLEGLLMTKSMELIYLP